MATSIGQYTTVFLPGEHHLREKPGRPQSTGPQRVGHDRSGPACVDARLIFAWGGSAPVRVEHESGTAAWVAGTLAAPSVQRQELPLPKGVMALSVFFRASCSWWSEGLFGQSFSVALPVHTFRGIPCLGSSSVDRHIRHLKGHPEWRPTL